MPQRPWGTAAAPSHWAGANCQCVQAQSNLQRPARAFGRAHGTFDGCFDELLKMGEILQETVNEISFPRALGPFLPIPLRRMRCHEMLQAAAPGFIYVIAEDDAAGVIQALAQAAESLH